MTTHYRNAVLVGAIAALMTSPAWVSAQQEQGPQVDSGHQVQSTGGAPAPSATPMKSVPEGALIMPSEGATHRNDTLLSALTPQQLKHMEINDVSGEKIGKVEDVVRSREDGFIYAVVSSGGLLGIGAKEVTVPVEMLEIQGDRLRIGATKDEVQRWPEYQDERYAGLEPPNKPISEFSAFEAIPPKD
jgi:sporulation protein YlmC with PRC-barrel domain